jgi:protein-tyrosine phosphatase
MLDLHSHILPGLDDGARTVEEARALARESAAEGVTAIAATPHVREDYPTTPRDMEGAVAALREDFGGQGIPVEVLHGGEIAISVLWELPAEALTRFTLAQTGRYLLLEFPYFGWPASLELALSTVRGRDMQPVLAHPERNAEVQDRPDRLGAAVEAGALVQVTAASLTGDLGAASRRAAERLLELELVHLLASDAHGPHIRSAGLAEAARAVGDDAHARYLTEAVPRAIAAGEAIPSRS